MKWEPLQNFEQRCDILRPTLQEHCSAYSDEKLEEGRRRQWGPITIPSHSGELSKAQMPPPPTMQPLLIPLKAQILLAALFILCSCISSSTGQS